LICGISSSRYAQLEDNDTTVISGAALSSLAMSGLAFSVASLLTTLYDFPL